LVPAGRPLPASFAVDVLEGERVAVNDAFADLQFFIRLRQPASKAVAVAFEFEN
jgi:hypothetical protein